MRLPSRPGVVVMMMFMAIHTAAVRPRFPYNPVHACHACRWFGPRPTEGSMQRVLVLTSLVVTGVIGLGVVSGRLSSQTAPAARPPASVQAPPGFEVTLAAAPPLVHHPTLVGLDEQGRLFVSEN